MVAAFWVPGQLSSIESKWHVESPLATCFHDGFGLFFDPEDGGDMYLRNVR
jgi:hypothetical protein